MRLLSTLLLICIILEKRDNGIKFGKLYALRSKENILKFDSTVLIIDVIYKCIHDNQDVSFAFAELNSIQKDRTNTTREKIIPHSFVLINESSKYVKFEQLVPQWRSSFCCDTSNHGRKLLNYLNEEHDTNFMKSEALFKIDAQSPKKEQRNFLRDIEDSTENHNELWDEWSNWSTCSVTCGSGRQVRWRHCSAEHCIKGLKRAQIKACDLKKCDSKNILNWLGLKTKE